MMIDADPHQRPVVNGIDLQKSYRAGGRGRRPTRVLDAVDFTAWPGEMVAIVGPSGSGKSTLLYCLAGLEPVDSGRVWIGGIDITRCTRAARARVRRTHMGFVFQEYNLIDSLTARGNVEIAARLAGSPTRRDGVDRVLDQVGMSDHAEAYPAELSGGQQQRIAVARALVTRPHVVFADEPTGALDRFNTEIVLDGLRELARVGTSVIIVTHDQHVAEAADRVVTLRSNRAHPPGELRTPDHPRHQRAVRLERGTPGQPDTADAGSRDSFAPMVAARVES